MKIGIAELVAATGGTTNGCDATASGSGIATDSRTIRRGEWFLALDGPNHRGSDFIAAALAAGAAGVVTHDYEAAVALDAPAVIVSDSLRALGDIALAWRRHNGARILAVSGSSGKTTTKEMLAHVMRGAVSAVVTEGNRNNLVGLPQTLFRLEESTRLGVVELGMNHPGELERLTEICDPDIAIITNIGNAHIGNFGGLDALIRGEAEIITAMRQNGTLLLNASCPNHAKLVERYHYQGRVITFGCGPDAEVRAENVRPIEPHGYRFDLVTAEGRASVIVPVFGRYNVDNALAAAAAALAAGLDLKWIAERISTFATRAMRSEIEYFDGLTIVKDCYNASPAAMLRSIGSAADVPHVRRRVALVGDMLELGEHAQHYHREVGIAAGHAGLDLVCAVGEWTPLIVEEASRLGVRAEHFPDARAAANFLAQELEPGDLLLVKGSRGNRLEQCLDMFRETRAAIRNGSLIHADSEARFT